MATERNVADREAKGRGRIPRMRAGAKLSASDVPAIRYARALSGCTHRALGEAMGVCSSTIRFLVNGKTWRHI